MTTRMSYQTTLGFAFVDPSVRIGLDVRIWHYAVVLQDVTLGDGVSIGARSEIGRGSVIGAKSRIGSGVFLPPNSIVGESVFIGPNVTCTDDKHPKVPEPGDPPYDAKPPVIGDGAAIGAGAVILPGVRIGKHARIAAGSVVTKDVPAGMAVMGTPARITKLSAVATDKWLPVPFVFPS